MNSQHDDNGRPTIICVSSVDGETVVPVYSSNNILGVEDGTTGSDNGNNDDVATTDDNGVDVWCALSSNDDGNIVEVYSNPTTHKVLINSL